MPKARRRIAGSRMTLLELRRVSKTYGTGANTVHTLREVSLTGSLALPGAVLGTTVAILAGAGLPALAAVGARAALT